MSTIDWKRDERTARAAAQYPLPIKSIVPALQYQGCGFDTDTWDKRVIQPSEWPFGFVRCSPDEIIKQFRNKRYTQALAMVACWGNMFRRPEAVWGRRELHQIEDTLRTCAERIEESKTLDHAWQLMTAPDGLDWTAVITSKTLHFLCRSLGFNLNPPVAIDGKIIRQRVWPFFRNSIPPAECPSDWEGTAFSAYSRYMTAISVWAEVRGWSTTDMEATVFAEFG